MKKFVSMLVVLAMVLSMVPAVFAAEAATSGTIEAVSGTVYTTDTWTAESDGVLTISVDSVEGVGYKVYINGEVQSLGWTMTRSENISCAVTTGDTVYLEVRGNNPDTWGLCDATINWAYSFDADGVVKEPYAIAMEGDEHLVISAVGDSLIPMISTAEVTVVTFTPEETGVYTITVGDGATVGNCGNTSALISTNVEFGSSVVWTCEQVGYWTETDIPAEDFQSSGEWITIEQYISGQSLMLGIISDSDTVTVSVEKTADYVAPTTTEVIYENKAALAQFAVPADATLGSYVDVYGDTHTAVLGSDGYYHLDSADGDILLVDMNYTFQLSSALSSDRPVMYAYVTDEDGSTVKYNIGNAVLAYEAVCDENGYYPLTEDLIFFYGTYAAGAGVFQYCLNANYNPDCAWMFACLTMSLPTQDSGLEGSGTEEDPYVITSLPYEIANSFATDEAAFNGVFYLYTPDQDGRLSLKDIYEDFNTGTLSIVTADGEFVSLNEGAQDVSANEAVLLCHWAIWAGDYDVTLKFTESTGGDTGDDGDSGDNGEGGDTGDDTPVVDAITKETIWAGADLAVTPDAPIVITFTVGVDGTLTGTVSAESTGWEFDIVDADETYMGTVWSDSTPNTINENLKAGTTYTITINGYDEDSWNKINGIITYALTFTPADNGPAVEGSGTDEDPYELVIDGYNYATIAAGDDGLAENMAYFIWTATGDGTLTLIFDESDPEPWVTAYIGGITGAAGNGGWTHTYAVTEGTTIMLCVETAEYVAAEYAFTATLETSGANTENAELTDGDNELAIYAGEGTTPYTYTATQSGTLYLTFTAFGYDSSWGYYDCSDYIGDYFGTADGWDNWMKLTINGVMAESYWGSVEVNKGDVVAIGWEFHGANSYVQSNYDLFATLNLNYDGFALPDPGTIDAPYEISMQEISWTGQAVTTVEIAADASVYYNLIYFADSTVTIAGEGDFTVLVCSYTMDENWEQVQVWTPYEAVNGVVEFYAADYAVLVEIVNNSDQAATYDVNYYYPTGHGYNPEVISGEGSWTANLEANSTGGYYYQWSLGDASLSGIMTITVNGESWQYYVENTTQNLSVAYHYSSDDPQVTTEEHIVFAGDVFTIWVNTNYNDVENYDYDTPAGSVTISIGFEAQELVQGVDYPYAVNRYDGPAEVTVAPGDEVWVELSDFYGYYAVINGEGAYLIYNGTTYNAENGVLKVMIEDYTADVTLGNASGAEVTYSIEGVAPLGHSKNPEIITQDGTYTTSAFPDNGFTNYYFQYTATAAGTVTVEVLNETNWRIQIWNPTTYASAGGNSKGTTNTYTLKVNTGDVINIYGAPYDPASYQVVAGTLSFKFSFEASQEEVVALPLYDGDNTVEADNVDGSLTAAQYTYVATQTGTLYLTFSDVSYYTSYQGELSEVPYAGDKFTVVNYTKVTVNGENLANGYYGTIEVTEGDVVTITWNLKYSFYTWLITANLNLSYEGHNPAPGSAADPIEVSFYDCYEVPVQTVEIAAGGTAHYTLQGFQGYYLTITGEGAYLVYNGTTYTDEDGDGVITLTGDDYVMNVEIGNAGDSPASFAISGGFPVGNQNNPEKVTDGEHTATVEQNDDNYVYSYTVTCDGILDITVSGDNWTFMIYNATTGLGYYDGEWSYWGGWYYSTDFASLTTTVSVDVLAGDEIQIAVNTIFAADDPEGLWGSSPAGTITVGLTAAYDHVDDDHDGCCDVCGEAVESDPDTDDILYGDVNGDGDIDLMDANMVVSYYNELIDLTEEQLLAADVNGDGDVDIMDANMIVAYYNEILDSFPVEE